MLEYTVVNGKVTIGAFKMFIISTSTTLMVGDVKTVSLYSAFEGPPERVIVGATLPTA
ncbi:spore gernimation protein GerPD [Cohnella sp. AR92]|uniref:spore gernimation protein GerPD n=1 Tax=Cohnella sp. AR92 TaxID=648716 RepID=UPI000F8CA5ED|nr:spore gernimation protein GerPD [Cohnella sp. AR92]RUS46960.1 spore gernimation protein GerPD [Cohnella sp. AR92]